jgi:hypothetical protein
MTDSAQQQQIPVTAFNTSTGSLFPLQHYLLVDRRRSFLLEYVRNCPLLQEKQGMLVTSQMIFISSPMVGRNWLEPGNVSRPCLPQKPL